MNPSFTCKPTREPVRLLRPLTRILQHWALWLSLVSQGLLSGCGGGSGGGVTTVPADTSVPTLVITSDAPATASAAFTLTFSFSGPISIYGDSGVLPWSTNSGPNPGNLASANADKTTFTKVSETKYTVRVTPASWTKGNWTLTVPAGAYKNATGTASSTETVTITQAIDTNLPIPIFSPVVAPNGVNFTGPTVVTVSFNTLLPTDLTAEQLVLSALQVNTQLPAANPGTISGFVKTSGPTQATAYQFLYTPVSGSLSVTIRLPAGSVTAGGFQNQSSQWGAHWFEVP